MKVQELVGDLDMGILVFIVIQTNILVATLFGIITLLPVRALSLAKIPILLILPRTWMQPPKVSVLRAGHYQ